VVVAQDRLAVCNLILAGVFLVLFLSRQVGSRFSSSRYVLVVVSWARS
jgi:hypothetical protein